MTRLCIFAVLLGTVTVAIADDYSRRGTRGTMTAYELDGVTVIDNKICSSAGRYTWDYVGCGKRLRDTVKFEKCRKLGAGTHEFLVQMGDGKPYRSSVYCPR